MSNNAHDLSKRLLNALDNSYNVVDMQAVNEIISILEKFNITKELLETTRLGKHVNELRRKTTDPMLARRAKVLVKRWRNLVIPGATSSPAHPALPGSNRSSAERTMRRLGGTPLTSPALSRQVLSPAVPSPRPPSRPAWGGYESDSQDVILVDDDPPPPAPPAPAPAPAPAPPAPAPAPAPSLLSPAKRPPSPGAQADEKKAKRDKKPKKRRGHSRAGSGSEAPAPEPWGGRNGASPPAPAPPAPAPAPAPAPPRKNGVRPVDAYSALVNRMPPAGGKKVKTTKELLEDIQSRGGAKPVSQPASPGSPDVMFIEPDVKVDSPLRNGGTEAPPSPPAPAPAPAPAPPRLPLEDERPHADCTCDDELASPACPAARAGTVCPAHVRALHHAYLPGINGTRAPPHPHRFAVRPPTHPDRPGLFTSVVPLYLYSDYADDYCVKNMDQVPLCARLPWTEFAPPPPSPPPLPPPPSPRPYPIDAVAKEEANGDEEADVSMTDLESVPTIKIEADVVGALEDDRLKPPHDEVIVPKAPSEAKCKVLVDVASEFASEPQEHRTVERTKQVPRSEVDGRTLYALCEATRRAVPFDYGQASATPVVTLPLEETEVVTALEDSLAAAEGATERDEFDRPLRPTNFTEWHECAQLGDLIALPYVVID